MPLYTGSNVDIGAALVGAQCGEIQRRRNVGVSGDMVDRLVHTAFSAPTEFYLQNNEACGYWLNSEDGAGRFVRGNSLLSSIYIATGTTYKVCVYPNGYGTATFYRLSARLPRTITFRTDTNTTPGVADIWTVPPTVAPEDVVTITACAAGAGGTKKDDLKGVTTGQAGAGGASPVLKMPLTGLRGGMQIRYTLALPGEGGDTRVDGLGQDGGNTLIEVLNYYGPGLHKVVTITGGRAFIENDGYGPPGSISGHNALEDDYVFYGSYGSDLIRTWVNNDVAIGGHSALGFGGWSGGAGNGPGAGGGGGANGGEAGGPGYFQADYDSDA